MIQAAAMDGRRQAPESLVPLTLPVPERQYLTRDGVIVRDATFLTDLPNGIYDVSVGLGDPVRRHDQAQVYVEGDLRGSVSTAAGELVVQTYRVSVADNQLTVRFVDLAMSRSLRCM